MLQFLSLFNHPIQTISNIRRADPEKNRQKIVALNLYLLLAINLALPLYSEGSRGWHSLWVRLGIAVSLPGIVWLNQWIWIVLTRFGIALVAPSARKRHQELKNIYPYLLGIDVLPVFLLLFLPRLNQPGTSFQMFVGFLFDTLLLLLVASLQIYKCLVSCIACQQIFGVSMARSFLGPWLAKCMVLIGGGILAFLFILLIRLLHIVR